MAPAFMARTDLDVAVPGDEYNGDADAGVGQFTLKIEPAYSGQPDVEHKATGSIRSLAFQKLRCRTEELNLQSDRANQAAEGLPRRAKRRKWPPYLRM
jgi:hypothetical protein